MASHRLLSVLLVCTFFSLLPSSYPSASDGSDKVELTLYYETLCPYCSYFIAYRLIRVFTDGLLPIVNLRLVPWGNAGIDPSGNFQCQHGPNECLMNTVEACAINIYPDVRKHFPFIQCIESLAYERREGEWQTCFAKASADSGLIFDCCKRNGHQLELQYADETARLNPPHAFVPWVLVNNQPLKEEYNNFLVYVCKAYKGSAVPKICGGGGSKFEANSSREVAAKTAIEVCYAAEQKNSTSFVHV
ncbi:hypothetical protein Nepgr_026281 [Nepenthes gracilis]|uniref:Gamma-interferon-inducible lysosomal thiol reductase n=1 Tax=Nepenthes gracilis TaxID=150966 RepID=A0AAD3T6K0_NEPGR|nr:hypothetical protein Nepgr_026281 [Nepenthes gracilis]